MMTMMMVVAATGLMMRMIKARANGMEVVG